MKFHDLVVASRTCRYFNNDRPVTEAMLSALVENAVIAPSACNRQPLRYVLVLDDAVKKSIFPLLSMRGGRSAEERADEKRQPSAYIVITVPKKATEYAIMDLGIAAQTIYLAAREAGLAGCMIASFNKEGVEKVLELPEERDAKLIIALGVPDEDCRLAPPRDDGSLSYYNDEKGVHWVPKLPLADAVIMVK